MSGKSRLAAPNRSILCAPVIFAYRPNLLATWPMPMSASGVISPPGHRGTTEYDPPRCMFANDRSFVSWRLLRPSARMTSFRRDARMLATAGLQISQPSCAPSLPAKASTSSKERRSSLVRTRAMSSGRECEKCSHRELSTLAPNFRNSAARIVFTLPSQPPQPDPALVDFLRSAYVVLSPKVWIASTIAPLETSLQLQICCAGSPSAAASSSETASVVRAEGGASSVAAGTGFPALKMS
mmetsp:Transcript_22937/g.70485  ORF Transcript_22937/g.70485 Transcript_22937/m.70485 type:complete len:240 (-) Transcript_22937:282-1001(-)